MGPSLKNRRFHLLAAALALALGWTLAGSGPGLRLEGILQDRAAALLGRSRPVDDPVVVLINEEDYTQAATPMALWGLHLAGFLDTLAQARPRAVGLDLVLPRFSLARITREHDQVFMKSLQELARQTRLVSGYGIAPDGKVRGAFRVYEKILGPEGYGFFNLTPDGDGVCRSQVLSLPGSQGEPLRSFASLLVGQVAPPGTSFTPDWRNPARFKTLTYAQARQADPALFTDRTVLIGVDFQFEDRHLTPASDHDEPGVVFHARVVEGLLNGRGLVDPGRTISVLIPALVLVLLMFLLRPSTSPLKVGLRTLALILALLGATLAALAGGLILRPVAGVGAVLCFSILRLSHGYLFTRRLFGQYVEPEVRDEILSGRIPLDGELKEVSLIFCDLRNFTPLVESTPPREVVRIINSYFKEMSRAIRDNGGLVLQYVGDEVYAAFGVPAPDPGHAVKALRAGLAMRQGLAKVNQELAREGRPPLSHGIGIHTGTVLAANIGGGERLSYSLVGDAVNLASRIQGMNKKLGTTMIISGVTRELIKGEEGFRLRPLPLTPIKGKTEPVELFEVVRENGGEDKAEARPGGGVRGE